jgi:cell wall-associated NlpC family hydrolase
MKRAILVTLVIFFNSLTAPAHAAPNVLTVQREIDRLRILAAEKFEAANEAKIKIANLMRESRNLKSGESSVRKQVESSRKYFAQIAIEQYKQDGLGEGIALLFSKNPSRYLSDASALDVLNRRYANEVRKLASSQLRLAASQLVIRDKTSELRSQQSRLNVEVATAKSALEKSEKILKSLKASDRVLLVKRQKASQSKILKTSKKYAQSYVGDNSRGSRALKYALQQIGDIYVWGGAGPTRWDCSGLTLRSFQRSGVSLPHSAAVQFGYGKLVSYKKLKPGDLLFFGKPISHVSIYMGGGKMVQAPRAGKKVEVVPFTLMFGYKPFIGAKRI